MYEMGIKDFEEIGREFVVTLNFLTDECIVKETYDALLNYNKQAFDLVKVF